MYNVEFIVLYFLIMPITTFFLSKQIVSFLDSLPKSEQSSFVDNALTQAIKQKNKSDALELLDSIEPVESDIGSVELVEKFRKERLDYLLARD